MINLIVQNGIARGQVEFESSLNKSVEVDSSIEKNINEDSSITTSQIFETDNLGLEEDE